MTPVDEFLSELISCLERSFSDYTIEVSLKTRKALKANIYLNATVFIAVRYNARNDRKDFALIKENQRIFGYDNLKSWHCHPFGKPLEHVPCDEPPIDKIIPDIQKVYADM